MDLPTGPAVVLTRQDEDNRALAAALRDRGVPVREIPCVATRYLTPAREPELPVDAVTFSSRRGVRGFMRLELAKHMIPAAPRPLVGAVGEATAAELADSGFEAELVADPPEGRELARRLIEKLEPGSRILVVRGNLRAGEMDAALERAGQRIAPLIVYENVDPGVPALEPFEVAAVFVASPSAAKRLLEKNGWFGKQSFFVIGRTSADALEKLGVGSVTTVGPHFDDWVDALSTACRQAAKREDQ